jgi:hypothetical protein
MTAGELSNQLMLLPPDAPVLFHIKETGELRDISEVLYLRWPRTGPEFDPEEVRLS